MSDMNITIDGKEIPAQAGQTILQAATVAGIYIPHLCDHKDLTPFGSCRVCTVLVNGRPQAACTQPVARDMVIENDTDSLNEIRRNIVDMLFVEGNHFCMFCEASGNCELQAMAYRLGILHPKYPYLFPKKDIDFSHPEIYIDRNRCILCARCKRSSIEVDGKHVYDFEDRGIEKHVTVDAACGLGKTDTTEADKAPDYCPTGTLVRKRAGYDVPIGQRKYDTKPIGSEIENG